MCQTKNNLVDLAYLLKVAVPCERDPPALMQQAAFKTSLIRAPFIAGLPGSRFYFIELFSNRAYRWLSAHDIIETVDNHSKLLFRRASDFATDAFYRQSSYLADFDP